MILKLILSLLFILPLVGSLSVLFKGIKNEFGKSKISDQKPSKAKLIGYFLISIIGLYIALFLVWFLWIPGIELPFYVKLVSWFMAAPYLLGVLGVSYALKMATEAGGSSSKMANAVADGLKKSKKITCAFTKDRKRRAAVAFANSSFDFTFSECAFFCGL